MELPDLPSLPDLPDAITAAIIAGAFAIVGQSLVKVWEVRQRRRDDLTAVYAKRFAAVLRYSEAVHKYAENLDRVSFYAEDTDGDQADYRRGLNLRERRAYEESRAEAREQLAYAKSEGTELRRSLDEAKAELNESDVMWRLYAKPPLLSANERLEEQLQAMEWRRSSDAFKTGQRADAWIRCARWELNASGSVGAALLLYAAFTWLHHLGKLLWWIAYGLFMIPVFFFNAVMAVWEWISDKIEDRRDFESVDSERPSGAGHHGTDSESTSETEGEEHASIDNDESGRPPGDRQ